MAEVTDRNALLRALAGALANVAVLTALLVYFGWVRIAEQSRHLGVDESLFRVSTREYLLRSVRPVLILLISIAVAALVWVALDQWLARRIAARGSGDPVVRWSVRGLGAFAVLLPLLTWLLRRVWPATTYVAFPLTVAAGLLLVLYLLRLRQSMAGDAALPATRDVVVRACAALLTAICLFSAAANYATVEGRRLAQGFVADLASQPQVVVYSAAHLHIDAPGATEEELPPEQSAYLYRYVGLRLLEYTNDTFFLVSEEWTPQYGVVVVLPDDETRRVELVRDRRETR
ncbi:hypothetical protein GCM10023328_13430 [Modestobacter marinus]|uniref:Uncharacterized protein n=1 Tax=Modestobacter marinus TaxID=477641 RepID=A0A846LRW5_9ACTN|nr:hypothetical protein [Modestobacter marinus]NIH69022.1 hypothetical protein [Modestobacter marinus]GGL78150.1 hypothetical protein GCM10011589_37770 [Modestobacter marinus]